MTLRPLSVCGAKKGKPNNDGDLRTSAADFGCGVLYYDRPHIMSWLINFNVLNLGQQFVAQLWYGLNRLLEPIYTPIRNFLPNTNPLDLAPLVAFIIVISLRDYILPAILF